MHTHIHRYHTYAYNLKLLQTFKELFSYAYFFLVLLYPLIYSSVLPQPPNQKKSFPMCIPIHIPAVFYQIQFYILPCSCLAGQRKHILSLHFLPHDGQVQSGLVSCVIKILSQVPSSLLELVTKDFLPLYHLSPEMEIGTAKKEKGNVTATKYFNSRHYLTCFVAIFTCRYQVTFHL